MSMQTMLLLLFKKNRILAIDCSAFAALYKLSDQLFIHRTSTMNFVKCAGENSILIQALSVL